MTERRPLGFTLPELGDATTALRGFAVVLRALGTDEGRHTSDRFEALADRLHADWMRQRP